MRKLLWTSILTTNCSILGQGNSLSYPHEHIYHHNLLFRYLLPLLLLFYYYYYYYYNYHYCCYCYYYNNYCYYYYYYYIIIFNFFCFFLLFLKFYKFFSSYSSTPPSSILNLSHSISLLRSQTPLTIYSRNNYTRQLLQHSKIL